ncbi:hypothetical protein [Neobacillus sp. Marseille-QA0830]
MFKNRNHEDMLKQPLMSTGTTEAGFETQVHKRQKQAGEPKIGETIVAEKVAD